MRGRAGWTKRPKWLRLPPIDPPTTDLPPTIKPLSCPPILHQKTTHNFRASSQKKKMSPTWSVKSLVSSRCAPQRLQLLSVGCAGCYCCGRLGLEWGCAAAPRQPRPGEGCWPPAGPRRTQRGFRRSATHRHLPSLPRLLLTFQSQAIRLIYIVYQLLTCDLRLKTQLLGTTRWRRSCSCRGGGSGGRVVAAKARGGQYSGACASG